MTAFFFMSILCLAPVNPCYLRIICLQPGNHCSPFFPRPINMLQPFHLGMCSKIWACTFLPVSFSTLPLNPPMYLDLSSSPIARYRWSRTCIPRAKSPHTQTCLSPVSLLLRAPPRASIPETLRTMEVISEVRGWAKLTW